MSMQNRQLKWSNKNRSPGLRKAMMCEIISGLNLPITVADILNKAVVNVCKTMFKY